MKQVHVSWLAPGEYFSARIRIDLTALLSRAGT